MIVTFVGKTDVGRSREVNEDSFVIVKGAAAMAVFDGVGGLEAGDRASLICSETMKSMVGPEADEERIRQLVGDIEEPLTTMEAKMIATLRVANRRLVEARAASADLMRKGMASTAVMVAIEDGCARILHIGDSRAYLIRGGIIVQVTKDHSLVNLLVREGQLTPEEAEISPDKNVIMRALGSEDRIAVDLRSIPLQRGDVLLACSDGLTDVVPKEMIEKAVMDNITALNLAVEELIVLANEAGGPDNITVTIARIDHPGKLRHKKTAERLLNIDRESTAIANIEQQYMRRTEGTTSLVMVENLLRQQKRKRSGRMIGVAVGVVMIFVLGILAYYLWQRHTPPLDNKVKLVLRLPQGASNPGVEGYPVLVDSKPIGDTLRASTALLLSLSPGGHRIDLAVDDSCWVANTINVDIPSRQIPPIAREFRPEPLGFFQLRLTEYDAESLYVMVDSVHIGRIDSLPFDVRAGDLRYLIPLCSGQHSVMLVREDSSYVMGWLSDPIEPSGEQQLLQPKDF